MVCWAGVLPTPSGADFNIMRYSYTIYHAYSEPEEFKPVYLQKGDGLTLRLSKLLSKLALYTAIAGVVALFISFSPSVFYSLISGGAERISQILTRPVVDFGTVIAESENKPVEIYQPKFDPQLPRTSSLKIPSIGVETEINEALYENYEEALRKGVWRAADFGTPVGRDKPTILVAHRFGYLAWSNLYRKKNSFLSLPKLKNGDTVEVIWRQRKYVYEIYDESEGDKITDYQADLVLYTCKLLNSDVRIFKYARLLEI